MEINVKNVDQYREVVKSINEGRLVSGEGFPIFLWDTTRKPDFDTMEDKVIPFGADNMTIANFSTVPFDTVDEYELWLDALAKFIKETNRAPVSKADYGRMRELIVYV